MNSEATFQFCLYKESLHPLLSDLDLHVQPFIKRNQNNADFPSIKRKIH